MKKVIMKFGGSLVASRGGVRRIADLALQTRRKGTEVVVVVSALGDVTDILLEASKADPLAGEERVTKMLDKLRLMHHTAVEGTSLSIPDRTSLARQIDETLGKLGQVLRGVSILGELSPRSKDLIVSFGERLSAPIVSAEIRGRGVPSSSLTGGEAGIVTDESFGEAVPDLKATGRAVRMALTPMLARREVPVVAGFIARSERGEVTSLGRGGSDFTATLLASALKADEVWIWTDVEGILSGDPRIVEDASTVARLSYAEAEELAFFGAKNMHPLALGPARANHIPVRIKDGFRPELPGTLVTREQTRSKGVVKVVSLVRNVGLLTVAGETIQGRPGTAAKVFTALAAKGVNILMISQSVSEANISMIVRRSSLKTAENAVLRELHKEGIEAAVEAEPNISVVAAVGAGMRGTKGVASKVFGAVANEGINVKMIAQGSSELNISFVVDEKDAVQAVRALHAKVVR